VIYSQPPYKTVKSRYHLQVQQRLKTLPEEFLKPRELDTVAVKDALKDGLLIQKEGAENYGKVFTREGEEIKGLMVIQGTNFIIR
jgi:hypothetical protein